MLLLNIKWQAQVMLLARCSLVVCKNVGPTYFILKIFWSGNNDCPPPLEHFRCFYAPLFSPAPPPHTPTTSGTMKLHKAVPLFILSKWLVTHLANPAGFWQILQSALFLLFLPTQPTNPSMTLPQVLREVASVCHSSGGITVPFSTVQVGAGCGVVSWHWDFMLFGPPPWINQTLGTLKVKLLVLKFRYLGHRLEDDECINNYSVICPEVHRLPGAPGNEQEVLVTPQLTGAATW